MTYEEFAADGKTFKAIIRNLEIAGEATKKIPDEVADRSPDLPWKSMARRRDKPIHEYFIVAARIVWETVQNNLPETLPHFPRPLSDSKPEMLRHSLSRWFYLRSCFLLEVPYDASKPA